MLRVADIAVISDGKPGHLNQSLGLADALCRLRPQLQVQEYPAMGMLAAIAELVSPGDKMRGTRLIIGAGHSTHLSLLAHKRSAGCPAIVLMSPSLPERWFDLCIAPRHDGGKESSSRWLSDGPLNRILPAEKTTQDGLILLGGPSAHYDWSQAALLGQLTRICDGSSSWTVSTSRRTPSGFLRALKALELPNLKMHDASSQAPNWLASTLGKTRQCWVSPDSASMVYEAMSAGCAVGLLDLHAKSSSRVAGAMRSLLDRGLVTGFQQFDIGGTQLNEVGSPLAEADRCAQRIVDMGWL